MADTDTDTGTGTATATQPPPTPPPSDSTPPPTPSPTPPTNTQTSAPNPSAIQMANQGWRMANAPSATPTATPTAVLQPLRRHGLAGVLDEVGKFLSGTQGQEIYYDQDGNKWVKPAPVSHAQQWARIGLEGFAGAMKGLQAGQGPGGLGRAGAAGFEQGFRMRQQQDKDKDEEAQKTWQMQREAKKDKLNMQIQQMQLAESALRQQREGETLTEEQTKFHDYQLDRVKELGGTPIGNGRIYTTDDYHKMLDDDAAILKDHAGQASIMPVTAYDPATNKALGLQLYRVSPDVMSQPVGPGKKWMSLEPKPGGDVGEMIKVEHDADPAMSVAKLQQLNDKYGVDLNNYSTRKENAVKAQYAGPMAEATLAATKQKTKTDKAEEVEHYAKAEADKAGAGLLTGNPALHGQDYLGTIDPAYRDQITAIANGDKQMPSQSRGNKTGVAINNMVMQYDPTYTDSRYTTKQNFRTKADADQVKSASTALAHLDQARTSSANLGYAPFISGSYSTAAQNYNIDADWLSEEAGRLVKGGMATAGEAKQIQENLKSRIQSKRDSALNEMTQLVGGRMAAIYEKYQSGTHQAFPVNEFFDAPTQQRLTKYNMQPTPYTPPARYGGGPVAQPTGGGGGGGGSQRTPTKPWPPNAKDAAVNKQDNKLHFRDAQGNDLGAAE